MTLRLHNNRTRQIEEFVPSDPTCPTLYVCGPTVYNYVHIGNARGPVVFGVLADLLRRRFGSLKYARNITDVDDKINNAAREQGVPISTITDRFAAAYREDMAALGVVPPDIEPEVTAHIPQIITMIEQLISNGHAYAAKGHVLFEVGTFENYGKLSNRSLEDMIAGSRVEIAPFKRAAGDFVLWKPSSEELPGWESPWGRGRPGWHIECSAMAAAHLGETIDIHAGGVDLLFPHHENEVAQSECAHGGKTFAHFWLHNGMLNFGGSKMSKSVGNIERVHDLVINHSPEALRRALLSAHYRQPLEWSDELIFSSTRTLNKLYRTILEAENLLSSNGVDVNASQVHAVTPIPEDIEAALDDDLNTPLALARIAERAASIRTLRNSIQHHSMVDQGLDPEILDKLRKRLAEIRAGAGALGLLQMPAKDGMEANKLPLSSVLTNTDLGGFNYSPPQLSKQEIKKLVDERAAAKKERNFARADAIRDQLAARGIVLTDTAEGTDWDQG